MQTLEYLWNFFKLLEKDEFDIIDEHTSITRFLTMSKSWQISLNVLLSFSINNQGKFWIWNAKEHCKKYLELFDE